MADEGVISFPVFNFLYLVCKIKSNVFPILLFNWHNIWYNLILLKNFHFVVEAEVVNFLIWRGLPSQFCSPNLASGHNIAAHTRTLRLFYWRRKLGAKMIIIKIVVWVVTLTFSIFPLSALGIGGIAVKCSFPCTCFLNAFCRRLNALHSSLFSSFAVFGRDVPQQLVFSVVPVSAG